MKEMIVIQNLKCDGCVGSITKALKKFPEVETVSVDFETATITIGTTTASKRKQYERALTHAGYPPVGENNSMGRKAKSFISCAIGRLDGV
jgi:copper chaperone